ncbi:hypothetical protein Vadar_025585 [Vaccinium darrowii]|uniref:Uncharacterized protein n=1 Tax=Vaccinium darrowii TaxID=229202 RepID=A0ACB7X413_9ERIC|nr:hypothetical protein Vadar_025585 [Vaccinium darrowii]
MGGFGVSVLSLPGGDETMGRVNPDESSGGGVLSWLDGCPDGSVVYVCFGSQKLLNRDQMEALALGLERSGLRFVWVVKSVSAQQMADGYGLIPDGFEDRVSGRGMVIKGWAPQIPILSHRAVGGFLSHCGWNSLLEGIVAGVMILAWPMGADQFVDARLLVEDMGAAVRVCEGGDSVLDSVELARTIAESMSGNTAQKLKAKELRDRAIKAVKIELYNRRLETQHPGSSPKPLPATPKPPFNSKFAFTIGVWTRRRRVGVGIIGEDGPESEKMAGVDADYPEWPEFLLVAAIFAVGGFLSHCGWNSLEGIVAGVMMLAWPMGADQFVDARLLVEDMGAAVRVCEGGDSVPDSVELARTIAESMSGNTAQKLKAKELRDGAIKAVKIGGSSWKALEDLGRELAQLGNQT